MERGGLYTRVTARREWRENAMRSGLTFFNNENNRYYYWGGFEDVIDCGRDEEQGCRGGIR